VVKKLFFQTKIRPARHYIGWLLKEKFRALRRQNDMEEGYQFNETAFCKTNPKSYERCPLHAERCINKRTQTMNFHTENRDCINMKWKLRNEPNFSNMLNATRRTLYAVLTKRTQLPK
jgi:hypothetical protein